MPGVVSPVKFPCTPGFVLNAQEVTPRSKKQTLLVTPSGPMVTGRTNSSRSSPLSQLDLEELQRQMADPRHRYDTASRVVASSATSATSEIGTARTNTTDMREPPAWIKNDRQVLRFYGYFKELCHESNKEVDRARVCSLYYYLEDDTMMISEPREENSGLQQGCVIKRHKVPNGRNDETYKPQDLNTCATITIYSRPFHIYGCDGFTREWYRANIGRELPQGAGPDKPNHVKAGQKVPKSKEQREQKAYHESLLGASAKNVKMQQFLDNDRRVLRFSCFMDDNSQYFIRVWLTLYYYLADDTVELIEVPQKNVGRVPEKGVFWKRAPLFKNPTYTCAPGMTKVEPVQVLKEDLIVGQGIRVQGRDIYITDCDDFTRDYYRTELSMVQDKLVIEEHVESPPKMPLPPHNGFGNEEDSIGNCNALAPKAPRKDVGKLLQDFGKVLRFEGVMQTARKEDQDRRFIVATYIADDDVAVWEIKNPALAHAQGKFAAKARKKNPATGQWFRPSDFYVGATVEISATRFLLVAADEMAVRFMESDPDSFPVADSRAVAMKLSAVREDLLREGEEVTQQRLLAFAAERSIPLNQHECMTLARAFRAKKEVDTKGPVSVTSLIAWLGRHGC